MENISRRRFVVQSSKLLAFIPFVSVVGCIPDQDSKLSPEDSLKRLIYIIGPWTIEENLIAEDFATRFLKTDHAKQYLPTSVELIQSLSKQIIEETKAIKEVDLKNLTKEEQEVLINLSKQIYSFVEVRFYVSSEPSWGECQGNSMWHTRIPK